MRPVVFNDTIGWIRDGGGNRGVVIAGAHGYEDLCSRRFLTLLGERAEKAGCPVIHFDYPGCGDAAGDHSSPGLVRDWTQGIGAAIDLLKRETGVREVTLAGFRLGALLAPLAACGRDDVTELVLLAPPASGRAYLREMTALSRMIDAALPEHAAGEPEPSFDGLEVAGFRLAAGMVGALESIDWQQAIEGARVRRMLVMPAVETPAVVALCERFSVRGVDVERTVFSNYAMLMCDPTANAIPVEAMERFTTWLEGGPAALPRRLARPSLPKRLVSSGFEEEPVMIGPAPHICGVMCRPTGRQSAAEAMVFLNAGAVPHVGWARGTVETARALAAGGIASLRIDLPGLGQSETPHEERRFLYDRRVRGDIARAIDWLEAAGHPQVALAGTCSGAFQSFHAARADSRVVGLTMINPLCFTWNSSYALEMAVWTTFESSRASLGYGRAGCSREDEAQAAGRLAGLRSLASRGSRRAIRRGLETVKTGLGRLSPEILVVGRPVERWIGALTARGVEVMMVTSEGDLSLKEIDRHFGTNAQRLRTMPRVTMVSLPAADHTLTPVHARRMLAVEIAALMRRSSRREDGTRRESQENRASEAAFQPMAENAF